MSDLHHRERSERRPLKIFISAGEASGDALGAALLAALQARIPDLEAFGMGGPRMAALGFRCDRDAREVGVVGLLEVVRHLPRLFRLKDELAVSAIRARADVAILIDVPDFNIRLAERLKSAGMRVVFYVGPSVWAWRAGRVHTYKKFIDRLLVLFPFELPVWRDAGVDVRCVGHPLLDEIPALPPAPSGPPIVALLPGSRPSEIARHLDVLLSAASSLRARGLVEKFVLPVAPTIDRAQLASRIEDFGLSGMIDLIEGSGGDPALRRRAVAGATIALVASGTATLETALLGCPQVIFYKVNDLSYTVMRRLTSIAHLGLPNIIAGREIAPELLQDQFTVENLVSAAARLLADRSLREAQRAEYAALRAALGDYGAAERAADAVLC